MPLYSALTALAVLALVGVVYLVYARFIADDDEETAEAAIHDDMTPTEQLGLTQRFSAQTGWYKAFMLFVGGLALLIAISGYQFARTGTPSEMAYADQLETLAFGLVIFAGSTYFVIQRRTGVGKLALTIEGNNSNVAETHYFDPNRVETRIDDSSEEESIMLPIYKDRPSLGLFWKPKLVADDRDALDEDKNLPQNRVYYEIPMDESASWDHQNDTVTARASDVQTVSNPQRAATYELIPSKRKSQAEVRDIQMENEQLRQEKQQAKKKNAILSTRLAEYEEMLENDKYGSRRTQEEMLEMLRENGLIHDEDRFRDRRTPGRNGHSDGERAPTSDGS